MTCILCFTSQFMWAGRSVSAFVFDFHSYTRNEIHYMRRQRTMMINEIRDILSVSLSFTLICPLGVRWVLLLDRRAKCSTPLNYLIIAVVIYCFQIVSVSCPNNDIICWRYSNELYNSNTSSHRISHYC